MSSELHKFKDTSLNKKENFLNAEVIDFPLEKNESNLQNLDSKNLSFWKLHDKSYINEDGDQLKAVVGICFMLTVLALLGLYSNLL
tara:strand:- start:1615 stop:1872 length:258 start_codon:yes stop_codon:yes gene_type:complete